MPNTAIWTPDELDRIGRAEELQLASVKPDGALRKRRVVMWSVRHQDAIYVRCVNGRDGAWFRGTQDRHQGCIWADSLQKNVQFVDADAGIADALDQAFRSKYSRYSESIVGSIVSAKARSAALKLIPR